MNEKVSSLTLTGLLSKWQNRLSWMLTYAEEAKFAGDVIKEHHFATCARQWESAISDLKDVMKGVSQ